MPLEKASGNCVCTKNIYVSNVVWKVNKTNLFELKKSAFIVYLNDKVLSK